jgi:hypothetical protein
MIKVTVNIPEEGVSFLEEQAARKGTTVTEALCRAISNQKFFEEEIERGGKVIVRKRSGDYREISLA